MYLGNWRGEKDADKIVRKIKELNPDVIFNMGDMFESKTHFGKEKGALYPFRKLNIPHYFVYGNHDNYVRMDEVNAQMKNANAVVFLNEVVYFGEL
ncbi:MAG: metallophosphoesterase [Campylobacteraceae bacterium]|nr:metallophosphoesterase [Campylobacteraceae bacterium]